MEAAGLTTETFHLNITLDDIANDLLTLTTASATQEHYTHPNEHTTPTYF